MTQSIFRPSEKQVQAWNILEDENNTDILFDGGIRAGKTVVVCRWLIALLDSVPDIKIIMGRRVFRHCKRALFCQTVEPMLQELNIPTHKTDWISTFPNGSQIWYAGFDDRERVNEIMGQEFLMAFLNEGVEIQQSMVSKVWTRLAQKIKTPDGGFYKPRMITDCNPFIPEMPLNQKFRQPAQGRVRLNFRTYDNKENLTPEFITQVEQELSLLERQRLLEGVWVGSGESVYQNIDENCIVSSCDDRGITHYIGGIDWGFVSAFSLWGITDRQAVCVLEVEEKGKTTNDFLDRVLQVVGEYKGRALSVGTIPVYCDHEPDRIEEAKRKGFAARKAHKAVGAGDSSVNWYDLRFMDHCTNTYRSMRFLQNEKDAQDNIIEGKHTKVDDHAADAARYALHGYKVEYHRPEGQAGIVTSFNKRATAKMSNY